MRPQVSSPSHCATLHKLSPHSEAIWGYRSHWMREVSVKQADHNESLVTEFCSKLCSRMTYDSGNFHQKDQRSPLALTLGSTDLPHGPQVPFGAGCSLPGLWNSSSKVPSSLSRPTYRHSPLVSLFCCQLCSPSQWPLLETSTRLPSSLI